MVLGIFALPEVAHAAPPEAAAPEKTKELYTATKVWTVHLRFTAGDWEAMEPKKDGQPFGGPGGPPGGPRPGGPGGFGPSMFWVPALMKDGDDNHDGALSGEEFRGIAEKWYSRWDTEKAGQLNAEKLTAAINATLSAPPPGGGGPGNGGRPPGMFLQGAEGKRNGLMSMMGAEFQFVHADLDFEGQEFKDVAVRYKGNGTFMESRGALKRSLKIDLNKFTKSQKLTGLTSLNLHSCVTDPSWMNEVLSYRLYREAEVPAPRTAYAKVFVTVPGKHDRKYLGLYSLVEDVDKDFVEENFGRKKGAIFKPVMPSLFSFLGDDWSKYKQSYDAKTDLTIEEAQRVIDFSKLVTATDDALFAEKVGDYLDLEEFARYMAVTVWLSTIDSILTVGQNYYVYLHRKTHRFQFIPWDLDHSFGQFPIASSQEQRERLNIQHPWRGENRFLDRVFKLEAFKKLYLAKLTEFNETLFQPGNFAEQVDEIAAAIRPAVEEESAEKLARFDKVVVGESIPRGDGAGGPPGPFAGGSIKPIKGFVKTRAAEVSAQLEGKSEGLSLDGGGPGGPGGPRGPGGGFNMGRMLAGVFMGAFDADKDAILTRGEVAQGFAGWFEKWNTDKSGTLTADQLRTGIDADLAPPRGGPPPGAPPPAR